MHTKGSTFAVIIIFIAVVLLGFIGYRAFSKPDQPVVENTEPQISENERLQALEWKLATSTAPWGARDAHILAVFKNKLWLIGGLKGDDAVALNGTIEYWNAPHMSDIWNSDDGTNWTLVTDKAPWKNRRSVSAIPFNDKLWVMGGWDQYNYKYTNDIWVSDDGISWSVATSTSPRWEGREGQIVREFNGKLYFMGGVNFTKRITYNDVWVSDDGYTWTEVTSSAPWSPRYDHEVTTFKNALYLTGGYHIGSHDTESEVWVSTDGLTWEKRIPEWSSRHGHIALPYKDRLWVIGGWHEIPSERVSNGVNDTWFTEDGVKWFQTATSGPWTGREDHMGEVFRGKMWLTGGMDTDDKWSSEIYFAE